MPYSPIERQDVSSQLHICMRSSLFKRLFALMVISVANAPWQLFCEGDLNATGEENMEADSKRCLLICCVHEQAFKIPQAVQLYY